MDLSVTRDTVRMNEPVFDAVSDHPVDCDVILPDYCPDIARILKTEGLASVDSKNIDANRITINGTFNAKVIYIPENSRTVRCVTHETPYSHVLDLKEIGEKPMVSAGVNVAFVNCRLIGPRRLQIRASLAISAKVNCEKEENFISGVENDNIEMLRKPVTACSTVGMADKPFNIEEELEIGYGKPAASNVLKTDAVAVVQDSKLISNKVISKGEVLLKTLYVSESEDDSEGHIEVMEHSVPISQIIDLEGVDEDCMCDVKFDPGVVKSEVVSNDEGENRTLKIEMTVNAMAKAFRKQEISVITDAFSTQFEMELQTKNVKFESIVDTIKTSEMVRQSVELTDTPLSAITDSNVKANITNTKFEGNSVEFSGDMSISLIATDDQGGPVCVEKTLPFAIREELKGTSETMRCDPVITVISSGYSLTGPNRVDMRIECALEAVVYGVLNETAVVDMNMDDSQPKDNSTRKTLTLYFADQGEQIWDIAKRYNTSVEAVKEENNLENDRLDERCMLLIPKKHCPKM